MSVTPITRATTTTTRRITLDHARQVWDHAGIVLARPTQEWDGTYGVLVEAALRDLLSDGPLRIALHAPALRDQGWVHEVTGEAAHLVKKDCAWHAQFTDGQVAPVDDLLALVVL